MPTAAAAHAVLRRLGLGVFKSVLPPEKIRVIADRWYPQRRDRALTVGTTLGLLAVAHIEKGTDGVEELLRRGWHRIRHRYELEELDQPVSRQAFSKRLKVLPWQLFRELYAALLRTYFQLMNPGEGLYHGTYTIEAIDGTVVDVAHRLIRAFRGLPGRGGGHGANAQAKLHTMFNITWQVPTMVVVTSATRSEIKMARRMVRQAAKRPFTIFAFDLGYWAFDLFRQIHDAKGFFVARLKDRTRYKILRRFGRKDYLVRLGVCAKGQTQIDVRLVRVREAGQTYSYVTNLMPWHRIRRGDVRRIYRKRWLIELFFKDLWYVLRGRKFFCYHANGIKIQVYAALATYVLAKILMAMSARKHGLLVENLSFKKTLNVLRTWFNARWEKLWCLRPRRRHLEDLLDRIATQARVSRNRTAARSARETAA